MEQSGQSVETYAKIVIHSLMLPQNNVVFQGRISRIRSQVKMIFLTLRLQQETIQCVYFRKGKKGDVEDIIAAEIESLPRESIVRLYGNVVSVNSMIKSCTVKHVEFVIGSIECISKSDPTLPIQIEEHIYLPQSKKNNNSNGNTNSSGNTEIESKLSTRLSNRVLDLRRDDNQFIFRFSSTVTKIIRRFLEDNNFLEIHTPKLLSAASEGGADVFKVEYFEKEAYLAQSPQFYKQMAICADFPRVFEIGPIFRAEKSNTHRHLTEFTGIDMEMIFENDYHEILDLLDNLFIHLFQNIDKIPALDSFLGNFGIEKFEFVTPSLRITFKQAVEFLREVGIEHGDYEDFNTEKEKTLGKIIKNKYHTDFFMVDQFPTSIRPFYTKSNTNSDNCLYSNSYDFFMRGEEILSGAHRINNYQELVESATRKNIDPATISDYLDSFKYGVSPHGGAGIGLERIIMLYLGINNIRNVSMFPRDPTRIRP